jgi:hypothetical protein
VSSAFSCLFDRDPRLVHINAFVLSKYIYLRIETLVEILLSPSSGPHSQLIACSRTCSLLWTLALDTPMFQYIAYAHMAGSDDIRPIPVLTLPEHFSLVTL